MLIWNDMEIHGLEVPHLKFRKPLCLAQCWLWAVQGAGVLAVLKPADCTSNLALVGAQIGKGLVGYHVGLCTF